MSHCKTCQLVARRDTNEAPLWDSILRTDYWDVVHNYQTTLPGWLVLVTRRHIATLAEMTPEESAELGPLIQKTSAALTQITDCAKTYAIQFAEHPEHPHVHFHIIPRMHDIPADRKSTNIFNYSPVLNGEEGLSDAEMNEISEKVRGFLLN